ncbi:MAG: hypothetical protein ACRDYU_05495 [Actinomycetes bacterium]
MTTSPGQPPTVPSVGTLSYPDPPPQLTRRLTLVGAVSVLGPGAIIASANIGSGEMIFASRGGSIFGYALI